MAKKSKDKQSKDADRLRLTELVKDRHFSGLKLDKPLFRGATTAELGLRDLSDLTRDDKYDSDYEFTKSELYGTPLSKGAISAGVKKVKDMPFRERLKAGNEKLDREATQAAREAGAEERREARGMKKGGIVKSSASKRADGVAIKGKTKGRMV
jgi:hypothetical protein